MATVRLDMRLDEGVKSAAERAAALKGMKSLTEYVVQLIQQDSQQVIREHESATLKDGVFDRFMVACEQAEAPNAALRNAVVYTEQRGIQ